MPQLAIPLEFFRKERSQVYAGWRGAFWRELVANSKDAGATKVTVIVSDDSIIFEDNGPGMSRHVCENTYLRLGASTKDTESGGVGGFGRARILTCFSMDGYEIRSQDYRLEGCGADYQIEDAPDFFPGFRLKVWDAFSAGTMRQELISFAQGCCVKDFEVTVYFKSDYPASGHTLALATFPFPEQNFLSTPSARMALIDEPPAGLCARVIVRVNGLEMFRKYAREVGRKALLVELNPETSRLCMTANRDAETPTFANELQKVLKQISQEGAGAVRDKIVPIHRLILGREQWAVSRGGRQAISPKEEVVADSKAFSAERLLRARTEISQDGKIELAGSSVMFEVTTYDQELFDAAKAWDPSVWMTTRGHDSKWRLLFVWARAVELSFEILHEARPSRPAIAWMPGFACSDSKALCRQLNDAYGNTGYFIALNPLKRHFAASPDDKDEYRPAWNLDNPAGLKDLLATAIHEVAHTVEDDHDSDYAELLTRMISHMDQRHMLTEMKESIHETNKALFEAGAAAFLKKKEEF